MPVKYFEDNPEIFAALVAAIAILGGLLGSVIGAKIQANGGKAQAVAAQKAAEIAAEAQRVAALWSVRQVQVAEFIQRVREVQRISELFYVRDVVADGLGAQLRTGYSAMIHTLAELQLIAHSSVVEAADAVSEALDEVVDLATAAGPGQYVRGLLVDRVFSVDDAESVLAHRALDLLDELLAARAGDDSAAINRAQARSYSALSDVSGITPEQALCTRFLVGESELVRQKGEVTERVAEKMTTLVETAREMLRSEDDVAPTVTAPQRRRWQRAG